jgi:hypothetical protein
MEIHEETALKTGNTSARNSGGSKQANQESKWKSEDCPEQATSPSNRYKPQDGTQKPINVKSDVQTHDQENQSMANIKHSWNREAVSWHRRKCLLVYDELLNEFDSNKFSSWFDVNTYRALSVDDLLTKGGLVSKIKNLKPEVVAIHTGFQDLHWHKISADDLLNKYKQLIYKILEGTTAKLCISLIVPIPGQPRLDEEIDKFNSLMLSFLATLRLDAKYRNRVFSSCNKRLGGFITRETGKHGIRLFLSERGLRKAWLILRDSLQWCLNIKGARERKSHQLHSTLIKKSNDDE